MFLHVLRQPILCMQSADNCPEMFKPKKLHMCEQVLLVERLSRSRKSYSNLRMTEPHTVMNILSFSWSQ